MSNIVFRLGPLQIHWYGILVGIAFLLGYWVTLRNVKRYGLDTEKAEGLLFKLIIAVIIGARMGFIVSNLNYFIANPWEIIRIDHGGLGSHGAIITVMILGYFWTKKAAIPYWTMADAISPAITVGHIFVRIGNFINGELYGPPTHLPWAVKFPSTSVPVHPSQLYEAITSFILLPFALKWSKDPKYPGYAFFRVMLAHSVVRFFLDFIRQNSPLIGPFVLTQIIALVFIIVTAICIRYLERRVKAKSIQV